MVAHQKTILNNENIISPELAVIFRSDRKVFRRHPKRKLNAAYAEEFIKNILKGGERHGDCDVNRAVPREMANLKPRIWMEIENYMSTSVQLFQK